MTCASCECVREAKNTVGGRRSFILRGRGAALAVSEAALAQAEPHMLLAQSKFDTQEVAVPAPVPAFAFAFAFAFAVAAAAVPVFGKSLATDGEF